MDDVEGHPEDYYDCETDTDTETKNDDYKFGQVFGIEPQYDELCMSFTDEYNWDNLSNYDDLYNNENFLVEIDDLIEEHKNDEQNEEISEDNHVVSSSTLDMGQCDSKHMIQDSNPSISTVNRIPRKQIKYTFCCLCGKYDYEHKNERHSFFAAFEDHRCIKCNKWFFQHNHKKNPCWQPTKYL